MQSHLAPKDHLKKKYKFFAFYEVSTDQRNILKYNSHDLMFVILINRVNVLLEVISEHYERHVHGTRREGLRDHYAQGGSDRETEKRLH